MQVAVIGGGISGLSVAQMLSDEAEVKIFEAASRPGGLIKCDNIDGSLFHRTGGHVFNSKRQDVLDWFWGRFNKDSEFTKATRNASVAMPQGKMVPYPIENHVYYFEDTIQKGFIQDLMQMAEIGQLEAENFEEFLISRFGKTLYNLYFKPYNFKVWRRDLKQIPLSWLEGKLPMPTVQEMIYFNMNHIEEQSFVHSSFFYAKHGGSQFIANRLAEGLTIRYNSTIHSIIKVDSNWMVNGEMFEKVIFCGNIKQLPLLLKNQLDISPYISEIETLESHGTTTVFCEIDYNPYSWVYMPSQEHESHRIICTGNFSKSNNAVGKFTGTIEFTDYISKEKIIDNLSYIPFCPKYLTHHYEKYTYPIQTRTTRTMLNKLKVTLETESIYLLGRFAEWEYYNMDAAIGAAMDLKKKISI